jgi:hypothetical protein
VNTSLPVKQAPAIYFDQPGVQERQSLEADDELELDFVFAHGASP